MSACQTNCDMTAVERQEIFNVRKSFLNEFKKKQSYLFVLNNFSG